MNELLTSDVLKNIKVDSLKQGLAFSGKYWGTYGKQGTTEKWLGEVLLVLLGFAVYQIVVRRLISTEFSSGSLRMALDDILKFGTMLIVKRLLDTRKFESLKDDKWQTDSLSFLAGFMAYDFVTRHVYDTSALEGPLKASVDDVLKFGTVFLVQEGLAGPEGDKFNTTFFMGMGGFLLGLVGYNYLLAKV
jgi:hypothetical protein